MNITLSSIYRPDIDGLRAIAVLLVLGFHFFPETVRAGYIGVDIFFVISGYLITSQLVNNFDSQKFSPLDFYARRIRRIFPALLLILITSFCFGCYILTPSEYAMLGKHIASAAGFTTNMLLLSESGYFDVDSIRKPLLHLWSLGVEEQFYIVWPLLLWLGYRLSIRVMWLIIFLASFSLIINIVPSLLVYLGTPATEILPRMDPPARFYLPQYRFWEFLLGATLSCGFSQAHCKTYFLKNLAKIRKIRPTIYFNNNILSLSGVALLVLSISIIRPEHLFFGIWALFPTLAAWCLIAAGKDAYLNKMVLSHPVLVNIGLISYPLYLWHWPILSFANIALGSEPTSFTKAFCIALSFVLAFITHRYIERPFRFGGARRQKTLVLIICMLAVGSVGYSVFANGGLQLRDFAIRTQPLSNAANDWDYPDGLKKLSNPTISDIKGRDTYIFGTQPPSIIFVGDSHINQYTSRLKLLAIKHSVSFVLLSGDGCSVIPGVYGGEDLRCVRMLEDLKKLLLIYPSIKTVVLANYWIGYFSVFDSFAYKRAEVSIPLKSTSGRELALSSLKHFVRQLSASQKVYVMLDNPSSASFDPLLMIGNRFAFGKIEDLPVSVPIDEDQKTLNSMIKKLSTDAGAYVIDPFDYLCVNDKCARIDISTQTPIYKDSDHLTSGFVDQRASYIDQVFDEK